MLPANAAETSATQSSAAIIESGRLSDMLTWYRQYAELVRTQRAAGLSPILAPDCVFKNGGSSNTGAGSLKDLARIYRVADNKCRQATQGREPTYSVQIEPVDISANTVVVYATETFVGADKGMTVTLCWKHTWSNSASTGWKLSAIENVRVSPSQTDTPGIQLAVDTVSPPLLGFVPVYQRYADAIQKQGDKGFQQLSTSDFVVRGEDGSGKSGKTDGLYDYAKNKGVVVRVQPLKIAEQFAVMLVEDAVTETTLLGEQKDPVTVTSRWSWKQTWRKTPTGWKIASLTRAEPLKPVGVQKPQYAFSLQAGPQTPVPLTAPVPGKREKQ